MVLKSKSDRISVQHKLNGNKFYVDNEQYKALCEYNKALLFAESKENLALAYANRSASFFVLKKYDECLLNIQWARENNYPADKIQKLMEREEKCKQLKAEQGKDPLDEVHEFFKLSHPPNPKIPFIADCLRLGPTKKFGRRGIYTNRDLKPGDIVAVEKAVFANVNEDYSHTRCCKCLKGKMLNLIPCTKSATLMFCSEACRDETYAKVKNLDSMVTVKTVGIQPERIFREVEEAFGGRQDLLKFVKKTNWKNCNSTVFDFDFSDPNDKKYKANLMKCLLDLGAKDTEQSKDQNQALLRPHAEKAAGKDPILIKFFMEIGLICETRSITHRFEPKGGDITKELVEETINVDVFSLHMNHHCKPNAFTIPCEDGWTICIMKPIKAGEEIVRNFYYGAKGGKVEGKLKLCAIYFNIFCECVECLNDLPEIPVNPLNSIPRDHYQLLENTHTATAEDLGFMSKPMKPFSAIIDRIKSNWNLLASYYAMFPTPPSPPGVSDMTANAMRLISQLRYMPAIAEKSQKNF